MEQDVRDTFIQKVVKGNSFVDIGGLWGIVGEKLSVASKAGASKVTLIDQAPKTDPDWAKLDQRLQEMDVAYEAIRGDILQYTHQPFDVVHSSGMLYHMLSPLDYLKRLRLITNKYAVITTAITQEHIQNSSGEYRVPPSGVIFMLSLSEAEKAVLAEYWRPWGVVAGVTEPREFELERGGWLWLPTATSFKSMCEACRFEVIEEDYYWHGNAYTLLLK